MPRKRQERKPEPEGQWFKPRKELQYNYPRGKTLTEFGGKNGIVMGSGWAYATITERLDGIKARVNIQINGAGVEVWTWCNRGMEAAKRWCDDTIRKCARLSLQRIDYRDKDNDEKIVKQPFKKMRPATRLRLLRRRLGSVRRFASMEEASLTQEIAKLEAKRDKKAAPKKAIAE